MNERIKLPAQEWLGYDPEKGDLHGYTVEQMLEFTELILEECCDQVREIDAMEIRKHFGITPKHHAASEWPREL